jgi:hypothetical protein
MRSRGVHDWARKKVVVEFDKLGYEKWRDFIGYGQRWIAETTFSIFKRTFGEFVRAKKFENMVSEMALKVFTYNLLINLLTQNLKQIVDGSVIN